MRVIRTALFAGAAEMTGLKQEVVVVVWRDPEAVGGKDRLADMIGAHVGDVAAIRGISKLPTQPNSPSRDKVAVQMRAIKVR